MAVEGAKIGVDDIVAAAATGVLRAMDSRSTAEKLSVERLVASGFTIRFDIWAGGFPGPIQNLPGLEGKAGLGK